MNILEQLEAWKLEGKSIAKKCLEDGSDVIEALAQHQKSKPKDVAEVIKLDGDRLVIRLPKLAEYTDNDGVLKVHGGNFVLELVDPRSLNKNGTTRYFQKGFYTAPSIAYYLDSLYSMGALKKEAYNSAKTKVINHLQFCKKHKDSTQPDKNVKCLNDNAGYDISDLHWSVASK